MPYEFPRKIDYYISKSNKKTAHPQNIPVMSLCIPATFYKDKPTSYTSKVYPKMIHVLLSIFVMV